MKVPSLWPNRLFLIFSTFFELLNGRQGRVLFAGLLFVLVFLTTYPKYLGILLDPSPATTYSYFFAKINDPLKTLSISQETHGAKGAFRFTMVLLGKLLGIGGQGNGKGVLLLYIIQSCLLFPFFLILTQLLRRFIDNLSAALIAIGFASIYVTTAFFWDYDFWFDAVAFFFMIAAMYSNLRLGIFIALQLACWTDERAVVGLALIYMFHLLQENEFELSRISQIFNKDFLLKKSSVVVLAGVVYLIVRILIGVLFDLHTPMGENAEAGFYMLPFQFRYRFNGIFFAFEGLWLIVIAAAFTLAKAKNWFLIFLLGAALFVHIIVAYCVYDITRSLSYAFPLFIICSIIAFRSSLPRGHTLLFSAAVICMLIKTQFLIFFMRDIPWTICSYQEIKTLVGYCLVNF